MDDSISRQAVIDMLAQIGHYDDHDVYAVDYNDAITALVFLPSAQPEWIPCSERLPSEGVKVLLTDIDCDMAIGCLVRADEEYKWYMESWWDNTEGRQAWKAWWDNLEDWQAWMPLPEPWKGEEHETD